MFTPILCNLVLPAFERLLRCRLWVAPLLAVFASPALYAATATLNFVDQNGQLLERAVVVVSSTSIAARTTVPAVHLMDQVAKRFVPDVIAINTNDSIRFPNSDDIRHHVYSFSVPLTFELPLYSGEPENPVLFREPGMVIVGCNIHDRMQGFIYIIDKSLHAVSAAGKVTFADLPDEALTFTVYHPDARTEPALEFVIQAGELEHANAPYSVALKLPAAEPDTANMTELQKKFLQLRHNH